MSDDVTPVVRPSPTPVSGVVTAAEPMSRLTTKSPPGSRARPLGMVSPRATVRRAPVVGSAPRWCRRSGCPGRRHGVADVEIRCATVDDDATGLDTLATANDLWPPALSRLMAPDAPVRLDSDSSTLPRPSNARFSSTLYPEATVVAGPLCTRCRCRPAPRPSGGGRHRRGNAHRRPATRSQPHSELPPARCDQRHIEQLREHYHPRSGQRS